MNGLDERSSSVPPSVPPASATRGASLFGKIPARPDFVRERFAGAAAQHLDAWLVKAAETMHFAKATLPPVISRFVFCVPEDQRVLIGLLAPSRDQVGRDFPLAIFASLPLHAISNRVAGLPLASKPFFESAEALIREVPALSASEVLARLDQVVAPDASALPAAAAIAERTLNEADARDHLARTLGDPNGSAPAYGAYTFLTATAGAAPTNASTSTVLDCPIDIDVDLLAWLRLAERLLARGSVLPSFFWNEGASPRLLLSLGPVSTQLLHFLAQPEHSSARLWPLKTARTEAADRARAALANVLPPLDRSGVTSVAQWIDALARHGAK